MGVKTAKLLLSTRQPVLISISQKAGGDGRKHKQSEQLNPARPAHERYDGELPDRVQRAPGDVCGRAGEDADAQQAGAHVLALVLARARRLHARARRVRGGWRVDWPRGDQVLARVQHEQGAEREGGGEHLPGARQALRAADRGRESGALQRRGSVARERDYHRLVVRREACDWELWVDMMMGCMLMPPGCLLVYIRICCRRLVKSVRDLGVSIETGEFAKVPQLTGRVWEYSVARVSKSNCVATKRRMLQCITMLNSTIEELKEVLDEKEEEEAAGGEAERLDDVEQDDEYNFDSSLSLEEKSLFESGLKLLGMTCAILKRGVLTLKKYTAVSSSDNNDAFLQWTSALDLSYSAIMDHIVDVGAALYPPIGVDELSGSVDAIEQAGATILAKLQAEPELAEATAAELEKGRVAFDQQVASVKAQIEASR